MSDKRPAPPTDRNWARTTPGVLPKSVAAPVAAPLPAPLPAPARPGVGPAARVQPPLQEVLKGLDARELEGETVFDQLFGVGPDDPAAPPKA